MSETFRLVIDFWFNSGDEIGIDIRDERTGKTRRMDLFMDDRHLDFLSKEIIEIIRQKYINISFFPVRTIIYPGCLKQANTGKEGKQG